MKQDKSGRFRMSAISEASQLPVKTAHAVMGKEMQNFSKLDANAVFDLVDKDRNGTVSREEFSKLHQIIVSLFKNDLEYSNEIEESQLRAKRRTRLAVCTSLILLFVLAFSTVANFLSTQYIVSGEVNTRTRSGQLFDKESNSEASIVQSGLEVPLAMLPYIAQYAPELAVESSPEFVVVSYNAGSNTVAYRVASIGYALPSEYTITASEGTKIVVRGVTLTGTVHHPDATTYDFCATCSMVQLKSIVASHPGFTTARDEFLAATNIMSDDETIRCNAEAQVGRLLTTAYNNTTPDRFVDIPAVCQVSTEDSARARALTVKVEESHAHRRQLQTGLNSAFNTMDVSPPWGFLTLPEFLDGLPGILISEGYATSSNVADILSTICGCCHFNTYAGMNGPHNKLDVAEFAALNSALLSLVSTCTGNIACLDQVWLDMEGDADTATCVDRPGKGKGNGNGMGRALSHSPMCPPSSSGCHPATSTLKLESGKAIRIDDVQVGDRIATPEGFEPVVGRLHADKANSMEYYRFTTAAGTSMAVSKRHHIFANGARTAPEKVLVGDMLTTESGFEAVAMITKAYEAGVYTIITPSGTYYVDGVASTTYVAYIPYTVWRIFADGYIHLRYLLGAPIVASGEGVLPLFAQYELLEILSLPEPLMFMLWPLTLLTTVAAELVNKVLELSPAVLSTCATATIAAKLVQSAK